MSHIAGRTRQSCECLQARGLGKNYFHRQISGCAVNETGFHLVFLFAQFMFGFSITLLQMPLIALEKFKLCF